MRLHEFCLLCSRVWTETRIRLDKSTDEDTLHACSDNGALSLGINICRAWHAGDWVPILARC